MKRNKVIEDVWYEFMQETKLDEVSWGAKIGKALKIALTLAYGAGYDKGRDDALEEIGKQVLQLNEYGIVVGKFKSINKAAKAVKGPKGKPGNPSNIRAVIKGRNHSAYGFGWRLAKQEEE